MKCLRIALSAGLIWFVFRRLDWGATLPLLTRIQVPTALLASSATALLLILLTIRWSWFLSAIHCSLSFTGLLRLTWAGQFFNSYLPGSIGGDAIKLIEVLRRFPSKRLASSGTIIFDRLTALAALGLLAVVAVFIDPFPLEFVALKLASASGKLTIIASVLLTLLLGGYIVLKTLFRERMNGFAAKVLPVIRTGRDYVRILPRAFALSLAIHLLNFLIFYLFSRALGLTLTYSQVVIMMSVVLFLLLFPVTVNGHGLREFLLVQYFTHFSIAPSMPGAHGVVELAVAFSLVIVANDFFWGLPGGLLYLLSGRRKQMEAAGVFPASSEAC